MVNVFLTLLNMSITASYFILAIVVIRLLFRRAPKWFFCVLWCLVGIRLICPISIESAWSLIPNVEPVSVEWLAQRGVVTKQAGSGGFDLDAGTNYESKGGLSEGQSYPSKEGLNGTQNYSGAGGLNEGQNYPHTQALSKDQNYSSEENLNDSVNNSRGAFLGRLITFLWLTGGIVLLTYTLITYLHLKWRIQDAVRLQDNLFQSEKVDSPFVLGILKPCIYLPYHMEEATLNCVIAHEQAHIKRGDHISKMVGFLLLAVYWFQPLIWLGYVLFCRDLELACDEYVVKELNAEQRKVYSTALLQCSTTRRRVAPCPIAFGEVGIATRIRNALHYKKPTLWILIICLVLGVVAAVCFLTNPSSAEKEEGKPAPTPVGTQNLKQEQVEGGDISTTPLTGKYLAGSMVYDHCFEMSGNLPNSKSPLRFTVYTNDADITFEEVVANYFNIGEEDKLQMYVFCPDLVSVEQEQDLLKESDVLVQEEKIFDITVVNEVTGEELASSAFDFDQTFKMLRHLYINLKFERVKVTRTQEKPPFTIKLYNLDGELMQTVAPWGDGVEIDGVYYSCGLNQTGNKLFMYSGALFALQEDFHSSQITNITKEQGDYVGTGLIIGEHFTGEIDVVEGVVLSVSDWQKSVTLSVSNETSKKVLFGDEYSIQIRLNGKWYYMQPINGDVGFTEEGYYAPASVTTDYVERYGAVPMGTIRFVKNIRVYENESQYTDYVIATEEAEVIHFHSD